MAECSYARCLQERRLIKRELMKWSKDMLNICGLERVAEELMGRRKWKHYQEATATRSHINTGQLLASIEKLDIDENSKHENNKTITVDNNNSTKEQPIKQENCEKNKHRQQEEKEEKCKQQQDHHKQLNGNSNTTTIAKSDKANIASLIENNHSALVEEIEELAPEEHNNNQILKASLTRKLTTNKRTVLQNYTQSTPASPSPSSQPDPIDWKPNEKCYFCVDGKLLTVNAKGELVAESGPTVSETDHNNQRLDSDSDSNESSPQLPSSGGGGALTVTTGAGSLTDNNRINLNKLLAARLRDLPANMTSMDSMALNFAALQTMSGQLGYGNIDWLQLAQPPAPQTIIQQHQSQQPTNAVTPTTSDTSAATVSPQHKYSSSPSDATGEQPLDLSAKPSPNSSLSGEQKSVRTKWTRATLTPTGNTGNASNNIGNAASNNNNNSRRTYSEENLNNALREVLSGKLGTRKAAVQYSVPRSTLRNKVNKLTLEAKRSNAAATSVDQDFDLSGDDDEERSNASSTPQSEVLHEELINRVNASSTLRKLCENNGNSVGPSTASEDINKLNANEISSTSSAAAVSLNRPTSTPHSQASPQPQPQPQLPIMFDPKLLLQSLLLSASGLGVMPQKPDEPALMLLDLLSAILLNSGINLKDALTAALTGTSTSDNVLNNGGKPLALEQRLLFQQLLQQQQQQQQQSTSQFAHRLPKSDTPETSSSVDPHEGCEDSSILKIPSYKPAAGSSTSTGAATSSRASVSPALLCNNNNNSALSRNGDSPHSAPSPRIANSMLAAAVAAAGAGNNTLPASSRPTNNMSVLSPQHMHGHGHVDTPTTPSFSFQDVIANSIHRTMNEQANKDAHAAAVSILGLTSDSDHNNSPADYKPSITIKTNIGGTDTSRFGTAPNLLVNNSHHHQSHPHLPHHPHHHHSSHHLSRQEAAALAAGKGTRPKRGKYRNYDRDSLVEAVKAVQRGEMSVHRAGSYYGVPHSTLEYKVKERHLMRPRKREPKRDPALEGLTGSSASTSKTNSNIPGLNSLDKSKATSVSANSKLSNAIKSNNSSSAAFPNPVANGMKPFYDPTQMQFPPHVFWQNPQAFSQLMDIQRLHEEAALRAGAAPSATNTNSLSPITSPLSGAPNHHTLAMKSTHELAESLYDSGEANGSSFLDGIIRKSLDRKSGELGPPSGGALLDQLLEKKTTLPFTNNRNNDYASSSSSSSSSIAASKRAASPAHPYGDIKRERSSPIHSSDEDDETSQNGRDRELHEHNNNNSSKRNFSDSGSSIKNEILHAHLNHNNSNKMADVNGSGANKVELPLLKEPGTSILQEKLAQIKSEQENAENL